MQKTLLLILLASPLLLEAQSADELLARVRARLEKVSDYQASGKMKTNVAFVKAPIATVKVFYKRPNKLRINNESGFSLIPKGSFNINVGNIFLSSGDFDVIDMGLEQKTGLRVIKLLPRDDESDVVLSTLHVDPRLAVVRKARVTTRENGTYELELSYGRYVDYGLADKVIFSFNTKDYKLPKGVVFDYDGGQKKNENKLPANRKGRVEIQYSSYLINKGIPDSVFL